MMCQFGAANIAAPGPWPKLPMLACPGCGGASRQFHLGSSGITKSPSSSTTRSWPRSLMPPIVRNGRQRCHHKNLHTCIRPHHLIGAIRTPPDCHDKYTARRRRAMPHMPHPSGHIRCAPATNRKRNINPPPNLRPTVYEAAAGLLHRSVSSCTIT